MSLFQGIETATSSAKSEFLGEGTYWVLIEEAKEGTTRKYVPFFAVEGQVLRAVEGDKHKVGDSVKEFRMANTDFFLGEVKQTCSAILGIPFNDVSASVADVMVSDAQPAKGVVVEYQTVIKPQKKDPNKTMSITTCRRRIEKSELTAEELEQFGSRLNKGIYA